LRLLSDAYVACLAREWPTTNLIADNHFAFRIATEIAERSRTQASFARIGQGSARFAIGQAHFSSLAMRSQDGEGCARLVPPVCDLLAFQRHVSGWGSHWEPWGSNTRSGSRSEEDAFERFCYAMVLGCIY
jgi:hypothetical protein